jgi:UDP-N-acetylglucosamine--N-acetylmuramyl-(pentapeptide) pyrophosphoryl-undecaprenol N-acetylglucosamine transferase
MAAGKPALLVPLRGSGTRGDQVRNAELFERLGAARVLLDDPIAPDVFLEAVRTVLDPEIVRK